MERIGMAAGANPPNKNQRNSLVHTAVLEGIAVFFLFDRVLLIPVPVSNIWQESPISRTCFTVGALFFCRKIELFALSAPLSV